jgi:pyridoxine 4-dehydrogenase
LQQNNLITEEVEKLAKRKGCTKAQIAIAWVRGLSGRKMKVKDQEGVERECVLGTVIPIPGATTEARVKENLKLVVLTDEEMAEIDDMLARLKVVGTRYPAEGMKLCDG